jgi:hypothetical protein
MDEMKPVAGQYILVDCCLLPSKCHITIDSLYKGRARLGLVAKQSITGQSYEDVWEYPSKEASLVQIFTWDPDKQEEPSLWDRHPATMRYRIDGHSHLEYIRYSHDDIQEKVNYAIKATRGPEYYTTKIVEDSAHIGPEMPEGTRCFHAYVESLSCAHSTRCQWVDRVYIYLDRAVVLKMWDLMSVTLGDLIRRLNEKA